MSTCPPLKSNIAGNASLITKDNLNEILPSTFAVTPGTVVTVRCLDGYTLVGESRFSCLSNGQWSYNQKPYCIASSSAQSSTTETLDQTTKIIIGVIIPLTIIVLIALIVMAIFVCFRERQQHQERLLLTKNTENERSVVVVDPLRENDAQYTHDNEIPYRENPVILSHYDSNTYNYRPALHSNKEYIHIYNNGMYLPDSNPDISDPYQYYRSRKTDGGHIVDYRGNIDYYYNHTARLEDDRNIHVDSGRKPPDGMHCLSGRDPFLWRNA